MELRSIKIKLKRVLPQKVFQVLRFGVTQYRHIRNRLNRFTTDIYVSSEEKHLIVTCEKKLDDWYGARPGFNAQRDINIAKAGISLIMLNRNGSKLLPRFFDALKNVSVPMEVIVVDHASTDESLEIIHYFQKKYTINLITKNSNDTYSKSNNEAARQAIFDYLLFINNDVFLTDDTRLSDGIVLLNSEPNIGLVGWKLIYGQTTYPEIEQIQHIGISFREDKNFGFFRPFNIQKNFFSNAGFDAISVPAVTAALVMCRKADFVAVDGFHDGYVYGYEDVDLNLKFNTYLGKQSVVLTKNKAIHAESISQNVDSPIKIRNRRKGNINVLKKRFGGAINRHISSLRFSTTSIWNDKNLTIGFIVTETKEGTVVGDYFTASELGEKLRQRLQCEIRYVPLRGKGSDNKYNMACVDILIVMVDRYETCLTYNRPARMITVAWMRNWFDRWAARDWFQNYDLYFCSSLYACEHMRETYYIETYLLRLATNCDVFDSVNSIEKRDIDISFVGSYWDAPRDIEGFNPEGLDFHLYGQGWDSHELFEPYFKGSVPYEEVPNIYLRSKIVIDDANDATKKYGSVNSRVFDGLMSGALVVTNGLIGANEVFGSFLPTYSNVKELKSILDYYLENEIERKNLVDKLKKLVLDQQTYAHRASQAIGAIQNFINSSLRISIKVPAPSVSVAHQWGDYHFALSLRKEFKKRGHTVRIDILENWYDYPETEDDVVLVLRGLSQYKPKPSHINLMWNISHPDKIDPSEYNNYDHVFVSSKKHASYISTLCSVPVSLLLQCTDSDIFKPNHEENSSIPEHKLLFVGNSRRKFRKIIKNSIEAKLPVTVYGGLWEDYIEKSYIAAEHIENQKLSAYYARAQVVLNDHWETMSENGFISNRLFDAVASGANVISDKVEGIEEIFGDAVLCYNGTTDDLHRLYSIANQRENRESILATSKRIRLEHSFSVRTDEILLILKKLVAANAIKSF